jgi:hypothetical protein
VKQCLIALLIVLPVSVASTSAGTRAERGIDVAMVSPVQSDPSGMTSDPVSGKADMARITYSPLPSNRSSPLSRALLNNTSYEGDRSKRLRGDRFEWPWRENSK